MKIGIIREEKVPSDDRVILNPEQCAWLQSHYDVDLVVEHSPNRCFKDSEYMDAGIRVVDHVSDCDILLGVKEVPIEKLIQGKTYFFFSHTYKEQVYNRPLLQAILEKNIRLVDYELLTNEKRQRLIAFGYFAGMVGAHNGLYTYGQRHKSFDLPRMYKAFDYKEVQTAYSSIQWPSVKIVLTGKGRVGQGAKQVLDDMGIAEVSPDDFLNKEFDKAVYTVLDFFDYAKKKDGSPFDQSEFFQFPQRFDSAFLPYAHRADIMINGIYWDNNAPRFFSPEDMKDPNFKIEVIADITCDIAPIASIPSTLRPTTIVDPVFGYDVVEECEVPAYTPSGIDMMTIDNLPNELPRDASTSFGQQFLDGIFPLVYDSRFDDGVLLRGSIAIDGELGPHFKYLKNYVAGHQ
ncbi:NAD(P)-dependent oxidoreductase [Membranihabitans marinus]|uniref:NAD(P)-dependent oxidoreductase n=1 Tax=Membranihabitans marinus TaxID=1227546 RepID=UPI001F48AEFE|nr:NAD(P)-dependent oxidoreductase [Membranihabitans marinus]